MPQTFTCVHGHRWEVSSGPYPLSDEVDLACPVCHPPDQTPPPRQQSPAAPRSANAILVEKGTPVPADLPSAVPAVEGYVIYEKLGQGGMGVVYKAWHPQLRRHAALKMIRDDLLTAPAAMLRFRGEAKAVAGLNDPNIVQVYAINEQAKPSYISMEYVEGGSLAQRLAQSPLEARPAAELLETIARAMHRVHQAGVIHRDLKPANILLTRDGVPKISDFGLAKRLDGDSGLTRSNQVLGTPSYTRRGPS